MSPEWFQSPSGVLGVCRPGSRSGRVGALEVSVPFRGFRGLQEASTLEEAMDLIHGFSPLPGF